MCFMIFVGKFIHKHNCFYRLRLFQESLLERGVLQPSTIVSRFSIYSMTCTTTLISFVSTRIQYCATSYYTRTNRNYHNVVDQAQPFEDNYSMPFGPELLWANHILILIPILILTI